MLEAYLNGSPVSDEVLTPGWTSYEWRLRYRSWDVTSLLQPTSVLGIALGNGWFRGRLGWQGGRNFYSDELGAFAQLEIEFADGHRQIVVTDGEWTSGPSAVVADDLYDGQTIDARRRRMLGCVRVSTETAGRVYTSSTSMKESSPRTSALRCDDRKNSSRRRSGPHHPARLWSTSARTSSGGCA